MKWAVRFIGDGDGELDTSDIHLSHPLTDHTLCGETMDGDTETAGSFESFPIGRTVVTCDKCIAVIQQCKGVKTKRNKP